MPVCRCHRKFKNRKSATFELALVAPVSSSVPQCLRKVRLRDAEHVRNVRFGDAVGGHRLGLPPLRVSRGPNRSSHWKIRPLKSATIIALCIGCTYPPGDWDGVRKNEVTGSNSYSKMVARYRQDLLAVHAAWPATLKA